MQKYIKYVIDNSTTYMRIVGAIIVFGLGFALMVGVAWVLAFIIVLILKLITLPITLMSGKFIKILLTLLAGSCIVVFIKALFDTLRTTYRYLKSCKHSYIYVQRKDWDGEWGSQFIIKCTKCGKIK